MKRLVCLICIGVLVACGGGGGGETANVAPVAQAGADVTVDEQTIVSLDGSASSDSVAP